MISLSTCANKPYQPRPYQARCLAALAEARKNGIQKGLVVMAGGLGKTATAIFDAEQYLDEYPNSRFLYLCDQETILVQNKQKFRAYFGEERSYGLYSGSSKTLHRVDFLFATLQSVRDHQEDFIADDYDYIIVDEAHHTSADTYEPVIRFFRPQFLLGLTATPDREDGRSILDVYQRILFEMDIYQGWAEGYLTRTHYELMLDDVDEQQLRAYLGPEGDGLKISMTQLNRSLFIPRRDEEIVASARERIASAGIENPRIFAFCSNITYAESMAKHFGDGAAVVHSGQNRALNEAVLSDFRSGKLDTVIAVDMLNEGVDIPEANVLIFLRATDAKRIFFQQLARGLRLSPGKDFALVLDYVINVQRIAMVLEMEETSQTRIQPNPAYPSSAKRFPPIVVNIPATKFRIQRVDLESLLRSVRNQERWTREMVIEAFQNFEKQYNRSPTQRESDENASLPDSYIVIYLFGTFNKGLLAANMSINRYGWTKEEAIIALQENARTNSYGQKVMLSREEINSNKNLPSTKTITRLFHGFQNAAKEAGLIIEDRRQSKHSPEAITLGIQRLNREVTELTVTEIDKCCYLPACSTCQRVLGVRTIEELKKACNVK